MNEPGSTRSAKKRFAFSVCWSGCALKAPGFQNFDAQHLKAKAPCITLRGLNQPVQGFSVSIAHAMIKIGKDRFVPVGYGSQQGLKCCFQVGWNAGFPVLVRGFGLGTATLQPNIEKALFQPVSRFQVREVPRPSFQDAVKEGGKVKKLHYHSTRYAEFCTVSMVELSHAICRIAI